KLWRWNPCSNHGIQDEISICRLRRHLAYSHLLYGIAGPPLYATTQPNQGNRGAEELVHCRGSVVVSGGAKELIFLNHGGNANARNWKRFLYADDSRAEADADRVGHGDVRRERHGDFNLRSLGKGMVEVEEYSAGAHVLRFRGDWFLGNARQFDCRRKMHIEAPHEATFLRGLPHKRFSS